MHFVLKWLKIPSHWKFNNLKVETQLNIVDNAGLF
jgi:hypothetical protein